MRPVLLQRRHRNDHHRPGPFAQLIGAQIAPFDLHRPPPSAVPAGSLTNGATKSPDREGSRRMNLHRLLQQRVAQGRPVRVALIGAGKFGSMFLAQVPTTPGLEVTTIADLVSRPRPRSLPAGRLVRGPHRRHKLHRRRRSRHCVRRGGRRGSDRSRASRNRARPARDRRRQAHRDGERGGGRTRRPASGTRSRAGRGSLFAGLWRPAGADLRAGGLGARLRFPRDRRREGDQIPARIPRLHARDRVGLLRADARAGATGRDEPADVQFVPGRHEVRHRDGSGCQRNRPDAAAGRAGFPPVGTHELAELLRPGNDACTMRARSR